jgi:antitoxin CcdA
MEKTELLVVAGLLTEAEERAAAWRRDNADAIASYNRYVEENGAFGEDLRTW